MQGLIRTNGNVVTHDELVHIQDGHIGFIMLVKHSDRGFVVSMEDLQFTDFDSVIDSFAVVVRIKHRNDAKDIEECAFADSLLTAQVHIKVLLQNFVVDTHRQIHGHAINHESSCRDHGGVERDYESEN